MTHNGAMIALLLPPTDATRLAVKNGEKPEDLHMTLAFLGDAAQYSEAQRAKIVESLREVTDLSAPPVIKLVGLARFEASDSSEGKDVLHAAVDASSVALLHEQVIDALDAIGVEPQSDHGFVPHVTLKYVEPGERVAAPSSPDGAITIPELTVKFGDDVVSLPFKRDEPRQADEPGTGDVHVPGLTLNKTKKQADEADGDGPPSEEDPKNEAENPVKTPSAYLGKMKDLLKDKVSPEDFAAAHKAARAHAGGVAAKANRMQCFELQPEDQDWRLFIEAKSLSIKAGEAAPDWIPFIPPPGKYSHPVYGKITLTPERNANFVKNFNEGVYQREVPIDAEHQTKLGGAFGWVTSLRQNSDRSVDAHVRWEARGQTALSEGRFRYVSPEWYDSWQDPMTEKRYKDVVIGGAITTRPFFKEKALRPLVASERGIFTLDDKNSDEDTVTLIELRKAEAMTDTKTGAEGGADPSAELKALTEQLSKERESAKAMSERIQKMESQARERRFAEEVSGKSDESQIAWIGDRDKHIKLMSKLAEAFGEDSEELKDYVALNRGHAATAKTAGLFAERGSSAAGPAVPEEKLEAMAKKLRETNPKLTQAQAMAEVTRTPEGKQLYTEYDNRKMKRS